ncbi:hypothetical protein FOA52_013732 [Chlamydomonas sp. UWO 241]|nr:hypothetical protein FOA52_013732 [Chlamydomonas sp. UWO 241]
MTALGSSSCCCSGRGTGVGRNVERRRSCSAAALPSRRDILASTLLLGGGGGAGLAALLPAEPANAQLLVCPGLGGYALSKCMKEARKACAIAEQAEEAATSNDPEASSAGDDARDARNKYRKFEQPGELVTLASGLQYREMVVGTGSDAAAAGDVLEIQYIVYRLTNGAYFKYSSGGTPVLLYAMGFGFEGQKDEDDVYRFVLGAPGAVPAAAGPCIVGMRQGGRRRILIPPALGWVDDKVGLAPQTFGGQRRLIGHREEPLLLEVLLVRVRPQQAGAPSDTSGVDTMGATLAAPYRLPAPPRAYQTGPQQ